MTRDASQTALHDCPSSCFRERDSIHAAAGTFAGELHGLTTLRSTIFSFVSIGDSSRRSVV